MARRVLLTFGLMSVLLALPDSGAAQKRMKTAVEGVGVEGLRVGKSTRSDVIRRLGRGFRLLKNGRYSYQMKYRNGLSFYYCQRDNIQRIFVIEMRSPYRAKTKKGIVLGKSTLEDIYRIYGKSSDGLRYRGVEFYYARFRGKRVVSVVDIVENGGLRQCN